MFQLGRVILCVTVVGPTDVASSRLLALYHTNKSCWWTDRVIEDERRTNIPSWIHKATIGLIIGKETPRGTWQMLQTGRHGML